MVAPTKSVLLALLAAVTITTQARATVIKETFDVTATGFFGESALPPPVPAAPVDPVEIVFTLKFNPEKSVGVPVPVTKGLKLDSINIPHGAPTTYSVKCCSLGSGAYSGMEVGVLNVGESAAITAPDVIPSAGNFDLGILYNAANGEPLSLSYMLYATPKTVYVATADPLSSTISPVPLPATLPMLGAALVGLAGIGPLEQITFRRKRRNV